MKKTIKSILMMTTIAFLVACSSNKNGWKLLNYSAVDQKSYAIAYSTTAQTYQDRVNESYDINAFMNGVNDWYTKKITLPVEQIRAMTINRMLDHNVYAYYSGVLYAADLQANFNHLSPTCWNLLQPTSMSQGIRDAMLDLQKNKVRSDNYIKNGVEQILQHCVNNLAKD
ncbi:MULTISPECIES: hypothetical protein [Mannheimia]|uniref:Domain amino terminal to FKBP-type peptidyl-prolyl isomerase n=1 Tax=Mannheimia pernigra TaxID=111844 RepID=A0A7H8UL59_9PAST|nr:MULTISPECIES: hypothetical protein [Mannheimia]QHB16615.1 hypothetical protein GM695_00280 [Mannheimia pernigra]QLB39442.1 hypothetical protein HV559_00275 [Mannheimia pernigra]QLB41394.1 hypothetical protein HV560_00275 [Mannheimia pernigra]QLB43320.1 hypothetical protein HV561_00275 [Mannheimia pernigra]QTM01366.1 hypothetical protein GM698_07100 [Mannheimia sp. ZY171111]